MYTHWLSILGLSAGAVQVPAESKETLGWLEKAGIDSGALKLIAKLDTGAKTTSLGYDTLAYFQKSGREWVRVSVTNNRAKTVVLEKRVIRRATIKQHFGEIPQERPVVMLGICLKNIYKEVEVDLMDRSGFNYSLLIGRNYLTDDIVVDPARKFTHRPRCKRKAR